MGRWSTPTGRQRSEPGTFGRKQEKKDVKIKVAVCGYGPMGRSHSQLLSQQDGVELVGVADVQESLRQRASDELGVATWASGEELIDAKVVDAVFVCAPTFLHAPLTIRALELGHHVFSEKPMGLNPGECTAMIEAAQRNGRLLTVGQVLRFWPEYVFLKNTLDSGELGKLQTLSMLRVGGVSTGWRNWFLDEKLGGSQIFDRHIHDTDLALWLFGKPTAVNSYGTQGKVGGFVHSFTHYVYDDKAVSAEGSADMPPGFPFTMSYLAVFEEGSIEYCSRSQPTLTLYRADGTSEAPELPDPLKGKLQSGLNISSGNGYFLEELYFLDCIREGKQPEIVAPESARDTVALVRLEIESARKGEPVPVT